MRGTSLPDTAIERAGDQAADDVPRSARWLVAVVLVLLLVPGVIGFDAWPLTGWRLFSLARDDTQTRWVLQVVDDDGATRLMSLEELPLRYRHAEWPMSELPGASTARRHAVCVALLGAAVDVEPGLSELRIARDRARLVEHEGEWTLRHDLETIHSCSPSPDGRPAA